MHHEPGLGSQIVVLLAVVPEGSFVVLVLGIRIRVQNPDIPFGDQVTQGSTEFRIGQGAGAFEVGVGRYEIKFVHDGKFILSHDYR